MVNTKVTVLLIVAAILVVAVASIAFTHYASAQANTARAYPNQVQEGASGTYCQNSQQGHHQNRQQFGNSYGYVGIGTGLCGRFR
jgi:hypothetical protein